MPTVSYDVSGNDPTNIGGGDITPKGVHVAVIKELNSGFSKDDSGRPDKSRPRLEVVYQVETGNYTPVWDYISFGESSQWKLDQFLQALGLADTSKRKGKFKTEEQVGRKVRINVKHEPGRTVDDDPKARVKAVMALDAEDDENGDEDEITANQLNAMGLKELRALAKEYDIDVPRGTKLEALREFVAEELEIDLDEEEEDEEDEEEEDAEEEDAEIDPDTAPADELRSYLKENRIKVPAGTKLSGVRQLVRDHLADETPF